jgi:P27 family predicted phage terminase small subunit
MSAAKKAPRHLSAPSKRWFADVVRDYELADHHLKLLQLAAECWDRTREAQTAISADGLTFRDDRGNIRAHPAVAIERDARLQFARLLRELDLDAGAPAESRPPQLARNRYKPRTVSRGAAHA